MTMKRSIHIRLQDDVYNELLRVSKELGIDKSNCARLALRFGLRLLDRLAFDYGFMVLQEALARELDESK